MAAIAFGSVIFAVYMNSQFPSAENHREVEVSFASELQDGDK